MGISVREEMLKKLIGIKVNFRYVLIMLLLFVNLDFVIKVMKLFVRNVWFIFCVKEVLC